MIHVGETGGILTGILERVAIYLEKSERLRQKVQSALIYPAVVVTMAMLITVVLLVKVVPTFAQIYDSLGQKLPAMTQVLIDVSNALQHFFFLICGVIVGIVFFLKWFYKLSNHSIAPQNIGNAVQYGHIFIITFVAKNRLFCA